MMQQKNAFQYFFQQDSNEYSRFQLFTAELR